MAGGANLSADEMLIGAEGRAFVSATSAANAGGLVSIGSSNAVARGDNQSRVSIGAGANLEAMKQLAHDLQIAQLVTFTNRLPPERYATYLAEADIGLAPYCNWSEFFGLKLLDYKAAGLATIASGMNGQPAVLAHGHTGWIVPPCDINALCAAIIQLSTDPALRMRMGRAARLEATCGKRASLVRRAQRGQRRSVIGSC